MKIKFIFKILFILAFLFPITDAQAKTIRFAVVSDVHYSAVQNPESKDFTNGAKALGGFVKRANENKYDFIVFTGDNINKSKISNLTGFLNKVKDIRSPYYIVLGNRDAHKISGLAKDEYIRIVGQNNRHQKAKSGSYYFYPSSDVIAIVIDNVSTGMPSSHGMYTDKNLKFLDTTLSKNSNKKAIIFQHVPYVEPYEDSSRNIINRQDFKAVIKRHDNIIAICSGHYHREFAQKDEQGIYHISAPALYLPPYYYYEIQISYDKKPFSKAKNFKLDGNAKPAI